MTEKYFADKPNIRLIASDMDGTLLDDSSSLPDAFWPLLERLRERDIVFVPASGRQYAALTRIFPADEMGFIAENGNYVALLGEELAATTLERDVVEDVVLKMRGLHERNAGVVVCGKKSAYTEREDPDFLDEARKYYARLEVVPDVLAVEDDCLKIAIYDFDSSKGTYEHLEYLTDDYQVVLSSPNWVDIMMQGTDKGTALAQLQQHLGIEPSETAIFGDFHNDLPMFEQADYSFAVENAHPDVRAAAKHIIPSNTDGGVLHVLEELLGE